MNWYSWIVKCEAEQMLASGNGLSAEYVLPLSLVDGGVQLAGSCMYVVERGSKGDSLFARLCVAKVEEIQDEDSGEKCLLLSIDLLRSARYIKSYHEDAARDLSCDCFRGVASGITEITYEQAKAVDAIAASCVQNHFKAIPTTLLSRIATPSGLASKKGLAQFVLREVVRSCTMSEIWGGLRIHDPFINTAVCYAKSKGLGVEAEILSLSEDRATVAKNKTTSAEHKNPAAQVLDVDLNFIPIDENHIVVRHFVAADETLSLAEAMAKTESAEQRHQAILREVVIRLKSIGMKPFQTSSCDLVIFDNGSVRLFEIKSMTESNVGTQAAKGLFQLILYSRALRNAGYKISEMAIIGEKIETSAVAQTIVETLATVGVRFYSYDLSLPWPERTAPTLSEALPALDEHQKQC